MYGNLGATLIAPKFRVNQMLIREVGTYNQQYMRPYKMDTSGGRADRLLERVERASVVDGNLIAGVSSDIISQSHFAVDEIQIIGGWKERRLAFIMEVIQENTSGSQSVLMLQGYSDRAEYSLSGTLDPDTLFVINSYVMLNRSYDARTGRQYDVVTEAANVVNGKYVTTYRNEDQLYSMRPEDLVIGMESMQLNETYTSYGAPASFEDTRIGIGNKSILSRRRNNMASTYLANTINSYRSASQLGDFGMRERDLLGQTANLLMEPTPGDLHFLRALSNVQRNPGTTSFRMADITDIDTDLRSASVARRVIKLVALGEMERSRLHHAGETESWEDARIPQWAATVLSNSVSAIMMDLYITQLEMFCTNSHIGGRVEIRVATARSLMALDLTEQVEMLKTRMEAEVLKDISNNNQETYYIDMKVDLFGETRINIDIAGSGDIGFCVPSFSDSILTPGITNSRKYFDETATDMENVISMVREVSSAHPAPAVSHNI